MLCHMPTAAEADAASRCVIERNAKRSGFQLRNRFQRSRCAGPFQTAEAFNNLTLRSRCDPWRNACPFIWLYAGRLTGCGRQSLRQRRTLGGRESEFGAIWMLDPIALALEPTAALVPVKVGPSLPRIGGRLGADDAAVRRARGSEEFGPLDAMPQHQRGADPPSSPRMGQSRHDAPGCRGRKIPRSCATPGPTPVVELRGFEPLTSAVRLQRSPI